MAGLRIIGSPNLTVGQSATLVCEYDAVGLIEWLDSDVTVLASGSGSSLNYTISPVSDSLHQSTLTCRVPGGSVSITLSVDGKPPRKHTHTHQGHRKVFLSGKAQASCGQSPQPPTGVRGHPPSPRINIALD